LKIAVISSNKQNLEGIRRILQAESHPHFVTLLEGGMEQLAPVAEREQPELIIMEGMCRNGEEMAALESVSQSHPGMGFILLCEHLSPELLIQAMRIGVRDVLPLPIDAEGLNAAVARVEQKLARGNSPRRKGKVLAFMACKGGSGATFLASNLGYVLAAEFEKKVALIDLNLQFGDASLFVSDKNPVTTLADVAYGISRLDASFLASSMVHVLPNFGVLAAPENPSQGADIRPEHVEALLQLAVSEYDYVILDVGRNLDAVSVKALDHADVIFPVLQETLPFIRDARRMLSTLQSLGYGREKIHLIVNRYEKGGEIHLEDVERTLEMKVFVTFQNSFEAVSASVNQGVPIMQLAKKDPVTKTLLKLGHDLEQGGVEKSGWLSHLFGHA
jgi:pilus assembly protein CpaE